MITVTSTADRRGTVCVAGCPPVFTNMLISHYAAIVAVDAVTAFREPCYAFARPVEAKFLSEFAKVRFATGDGRLMTALENVARLSPDQLPEIPGKSNAPEGWRRLAALHRELSRLRGKPTHFLAYRDAARVFDGMSHQEAHVITGALETLGAIKIVRKGRAGLNSRIAAEFRYLLPLDGE